MKINNNQLMRRAFTAIVVILTALVTYAQPASEYCRWQFGTATATNRCKWTWTTRADGAIVIKIISAIDGETAGQTCFRGNGVTEARIRAFTVNGDANAADKWFKRELTTYDGLTEMVLIPQQTIPDGAIISSANQTFEWRTSLNNNAYSGITFTWTYGSTAQCPEPGPLPAPTNVAVASDGTLTFDAVPNAVSYRATVYVGTMPYHQDNTVVPTGTVLAFNLPGEYIVKVKAIGDDNMYLNSEESEGAAWTIAGTPPTVGNSEYCYTYWDPSGAGAGVDADDAVVLKWETAENGNILVTMYSVNGNVASWRSPGLSAENFKLGPMEALGTTYITTTSSGAVVTIAPKAGVTFPQGMVIKYSGNVLYKTEGGANPNGNLWPTGNFTYTYGSNCSAIILTELDKPTNVSIDADGLLTFDPVANADNYIAYVYLGTTLVYQQATMQIGDKLNFPLPGNFNVTVVANPAPTNMGTYASSQPSDPYEWSVVWDMPATVAQSVYCDYLVNPTGGNSLGGGNTPDDDSYWKWETDAEGQIVITIVRPEVADYAATTSFRAGGMQVGNFKIGGVSGTLLLDKVTPNGLYTTQVFKAKPGITLLPGLGITYSGQVEYRITDADHNGTDAGAINDLYPTLTFSTPFIYGSNCSGTATVLGTPQNLTIADNKLSFDAVTDATSYTVFIAAKDGTLVNTIPNFTSGQELVYDAPGYYDVKVQAIGNGSTFVSGDRSAATEWKKIAKLGTPTDLYVSLDNKLSFASVPAAEAYTVYVYDQAAATTAVVTLPNFVAGSTVAMGDKPYGTYYIKVQATGDNDVKLDGDLSAALTWEFAEPCNMLNDYPPRLGTESDTWTKPDGTTQTGAPYFAPGWAPSTNYSVEYSASGVKIHLGSATSADWQAQFRFLTTPTLPLDATKQYTITLRVKTSKSTPVYCKLFDKDDNVFIEVVPRQAINAPEGRLFTLENVRLDGTASGLQNVFQIYFDFGGNPADVDITLSDYLICEKEIPAAPLATPTGLAVSPDNKLSFNAVQYASSYKVFVYDQAAATTPVVTLENFAIGSVIDMGSKAYGTYYVKVQAIGDGVLNLDSELSAALEWNYAEPCNLFLDNPVRLGTTEDTFTKPDGTAANCAPYVAQGWEWAASTNYTAIIDNGIVKIHLGDATVADWQAQFRLLPTPMLALNQSDEYTFSVKVKTSSDATVYSKLFQYDDNKFIEPIVRQKVNNTTKVFTWTGKANGLENVFQVLFDLAPSPANTNVEISDFTLCNKKSGMVYDLISGLVISPNPAKDVLNIHGLTKATRVTISSVSGKQIMSVITGGLIDVSTLPAGVYLLQVDGKTTKFIKK